MANLKATLNVALISIIMLFVLLFAGQIVYNAMVNSIDETDRNGETSIFGSAWGLIGADSNDTDNKGLLGPAMVIVVIMALVGLILFAVKSGGFSRKKRY